jgi:hypothetical protein
VKNSIFRDITAIFEVEEYAKKETSVKAELFALLATCFHASFCLAYSSTPEDGGDMFLRNIG